MLFTVVISRRRGDPGSHRAYQSDTSFSKSPYCLPNNSYDVIIDNFASDQLIS